MTVSLRKHPTAPRTYLAPDGHLLVVSDAQVDAWTSEEDWVSGADPSWAVPTLKAARERLAVAEAVRFTLEVEVVGTTLARVLDLLNDAIMADPHVKVVEVRS